MNRVRTALARLLEWTVVVLLVSLVLIVVLGVVFRKAGHSLVWYDEVASVNLVWLTYYGAALAALKRSHIGFPGLVEATPLPWRLWLVAAAELCVLAFFVLLAWMGLVVLRVLGGDTLVSLPWVPVRLTQSVIPIGAVMFMAAQLLSLPAVWTRARRGERSIDTEAMPS